MLLFEVCFYLWVGDVPPLSLEGDWLSSGNMWDTFSDTHLHCCCFSCFLSSFAVGFLFLVFPGKPGEEKLWWLGSVSVLNFPAMLCSIIINNFNIKYEKVYSYSLCRNTLQVVVITISPELLDLWLQFKADYILSIVFDNALVNIKAMKKNIYFIKNLGKKN